MLRMLNATHAYCNAVRLNDGSWAGRNGSVDGWAPSTVSREIRRNGGWRAYRASEADASAWQCARHGTHRPSGHHPAGDLLAFRQLQHQDRATACRGRYAAGSRQDATDRGMVTIK